MTGSSGFSRKWAAAGAALAVTAPAAAEELRIGFLAPMTGIFAQVGKDMANGFQMYLDETGGNFGGGQVTLIVEDEEGKPPVGVRKAEKLVRQGKGPQFTRGGGRAAGGGA